MSSPLQCTNLSQLRTTIQACLSPDLLHKNFRPQWAPDNPTWGFCSVASEAAWFVLGGSQKGWSAYTARDEKGIVHWWLQHTSGLIFDPTEEQYTSQGKKPPYRAGAAGRIGGFMGVRKDEGNEWGFDRKPSLRAQQLLDKMVEHATAPKETKNVHRRSP